MPAEVETMAYHGETPWHGLGKEVSNVMTSQEAIVAAELDWEVEMIDVFHLWGGNTVKIEGKAGVRRKTDGNILAVLTPNYKPVQNIDAFRFFDDVVGTGEAKYHTAGSLRGGKRVWMLAKVKGSIGIKGDEVEKYLLLMNGHDGTAACKMFYTPVRVVCMNTLRTAEASAKRIETFYAKHTGDISGRLNKAKEILGMTNTFFEKFKAEATRLASFQLPPAELPKLLVAAYGTTGAINPEDIVNLQDFGSSRKVREMVNVQRLFEGEGKGLNEPRIKGTAWAAYNAIVEHVDYGKQFRGECPEDNRLEYVWQSEGSRIKARAWDYLLAM